MVGKISLEHHFVQGYNFLASMKSLSTFLRSLHSFIQSRFLLFVRGCRRIRILKRKVCRGEWKCGNCLQVKFGIILSLNWMLHDSKN